MGNEKSQPKITIESFVINSKDEELQNVSEDEIEKSIYELYNIFLQNPKAYEEFKKNDQKQSLQQNYLNNKESDSDFSKSKKMTKVQKYQTILINLVLRRFEKESISLVLTRLVRFIINERDFLSIFLKKALEHLCSVVMGTEGKISDTLFIEENELLIDILNILISSPELLDKNLSIISKIFAIPQKINEANYSSNYIIYFTLCRLFNKCILTLVTIQKRAANSKYSIQKEYDDCIKNTITDYYSSSLFSNLINNFKNEKVEVVFKKIYPGQEDLLIDTILNQKTSTKTPISKNTPKEKEEKEEKEKKENINKLTEEIIQKFEDDLTYRITNVDFHETPPFINILSFRYLCKIKYIFAESILRPEVEIEYLLGFILNNESIATDKEAKTDLKKQYYIDLFEEIIVFFISFFIHYCTNNTINEKDSISVLDTKDPSFLKKITILFSIFEKTINRNLKFLISCLFALISVNRSVWETLINEEMITPTKNYIMLFIKEIFSPKNNTKSLVREKIMIKKLISFLNFICTDKIFERIRHTDFYKIYFDVVLLLFYINSPTFRFDILNVMNVFTMLEDCKETYFDKKNKKIQEILLQRIEELFSQLVNCNKIAETLFSQIASLEKKVSVTIDQAQYKSSENLALSNTFFSNIKDNFSNVAQQFGCLISIFVNIMINSKFEDNITILCRGNDEEMLGSKNLTSPDEDNKKYNFCKFYKFHVFFKRLRALKPELTKGFFFLKKLTRLTKYTFQIPLAILIYNPTVGIILEENILEETYEENEIRNEGTNLVAMIELLKENKKDNDLCHKILFSINRFFCKQNDTRLLLDSIRKLVIELAVILEENVPLFVTREIFRILCTLTMGNNNCFLWLKFDSDKMIIDSSNTNDLVLKYMEDSLNWNKKTDPLDTYINKEETVDPAQEKKVIRLPYLKVKPFNDSMGIITYDRHCFILPKPLKLSGELDSSFTLWFRFFNPVIDTKKWHTLFQDQTGLISIIAINSTGNRIGTFASNGDFIDSGIDLSSPNYMNKWINIALVFTSYGVKEESQVTGEIKWFINGYPIVLNMIISGVDTDGNISSYVTNKVILPDNIQYIGNSRDYDEPFGAFCDVRVYRGAKDDTEIANLYKMDDKTYRTDDDDIMKIIYDNIGKNFVKYVITNQYLSEEVLYLAVKFANNLMCVLDYRQMFINFGFVLKVSQEGFEYKKIEIKKELVKYLDIIS